MALWPLAAGETRSCLVLAQ